MDISLPIESPPLSRRQLLNFITGATVAATAGSALALYVTGKFFILPVEKTGVGGAMMAILISPWAETDPRTGEKPWWV